MTLLEETSPESLREASIPVLKTKHLTLRAPRLEDAKAIAKLANDRRIAENTARIPHPYSLDDAKSFIAASGTAGGETTFVMTLADGTLVGTCGITQLEGAVPELGYWIGHPFWGQGYATEAVRAVVDYGFTDCGYDVVQGGARVTNPASRRVLEKCGFQWIGVGLYRIRAIASSAPIDRFRLERSIWASLKSWGPMQRVA